MLLRGIAMWAGLRFATAVPVRYLGYSIDTVLLTAALMLATALHLAPLADPWVTAKVFLVVAYLGVAYVTLNGSRTSRRRRTLVWLALGLFACTYAVARARNSALWSHWPF